MPQPLDATIAAALISAGVGGLIAFLSAYLTARQAALTQKELLRDQFRQERLSALMPLRSEALQITWLYLVKIRQGTPLVEAERDRYVSLTIWLPRSLRPLCLEVLAKRDSELAARAQEQLLRWIERFETEG